MYDVIQTALLSAAKMPYLLFNIPWERVRLAYGLAKKPRGD